MIRFIISTALLICIVQPGMGSTQAMSTSQFQTQLQRRQLFRVERRVEIFLGEDVEDFAVFLPLPPDTTAQKVLRIVISPEPDRIETAGDQRYAVFQSPLQRLQYRTFRYFADIEVARPFKVTGLSDIQRSTSESDQGYYVSDSFRTALTREAADHISRPGILDTIRAGINLANERVQNISQCRYITPDKLLEAGRGTRIEKVFLSSHLSRLNHIPSRMAQARDLVWQQVWVPSYGWIDVDDQGGGNFVVAGKPVLQVFHDRRRWAPAGIAPGPSFRLEGVWSGVFRSERFYFADVVGIRKQGG